MNDEMFETLSRAHTQLQDQVQKLADATLALADRMAAMSERIKQLEYRTMRTSTSAKP